MAKHIELRKEGKLEHLQLAIIYPWHCFSRKSMYKKYPSDKALIIDHSKKPKIARPPPIEWIELYHKGILHAQSYRKILPFIPLGLWCLIYGFKLDRQPFDLADLLTV